jgi:hypothetical protein
MIDDQEEYEVELIHNHRYYGRKRTLQYLIKWKGYPESDNTWEAAGDVHAPDLVKAYHRKTPLEGIKAGEFQRQKPIIRQAVSHTLIPPSLLPLHYSRIPRLQTWAPLSPDSYSRNPALPLLHRPLLPLSH